MYRIRDIIFTHTHTRIHIKCTLYKNCFVCYIKKILTNCWGQVRGARLNDLVEIVALKPCHLTIVEGMLYHIHMYACNANFFFFLLKIIIPTKWTHVLFKASVISFNLAVRTLINVLCDYNP